jgi:hypothetical protein
MRPDGTTRAAAPRLSTQVVAAGFNTKDTMGTKEQPTCLTLVSWWPLC